MGTEANAGQNAVSIGVGSSSASSGVCLGRNTVCNVDGVALGSYSNALKDSTAVGYTSTSFSAGSTAIGVSSEAGLTGIFNISFALGRSSKKKIRPLPLLQISTQAKTTLRQINQTLWQIKPTLWQINPTLRQIKPTCGKSNRHYGN